jgi:hypothetical protein
LTELERDHESFPEFLVTAEISRAILDLTFIYFEFVLNAVATERQLIVNIKRIACKDI